MLHLFIKSRIYTSILVEAIQSAISGFLSTTYSYEKKAGEYKEEIIKEKPKGNHYWDLIMKKDLKEEAESNPYL